MIHLEHIGEPNVWVRRFKLGQFNVTQRLLIEETRARFTLLTTRVVFAANQGTTEVGVDDHHRDIFRHRHRTRAQRAAVEQHGVIFPAQRGDQLVHDAAVTADELVFRFLTIYGNGGAIQRQIIELLHHGADRHFQRRR